VKVRRHALAAVAITAAVLAGTINLAEAGEPIGGASSQVCDQTGCDPPHATVECRRTAFAWGGECWSKKEGRAFQTWLVSRGASPKLFAVRHPELAAIFVQPWPPRKPRQAWQTCETGAACARSVIQHVFGGNWQYAYAIAGCETGGTYYNRAVGSAGERGIFQIHPVHFGWLDENQLWDVRYNTRIAYRMSRGGSSWQPWTCSRLV
jgi:hypothetical protein